MIKKIIKHLKENWFRYGLETLVVIVGVLIAFSLNNWNEERKADVNKAQLLENLITEFEYNLEALEATSFVDSMLYQNLAKLLGRMNSENDDSLNFLVGGTMYIQTFDPTNGALRSAISSGEIHLIRNTELLAKLFAWEDLINDLNEEQHLLRDEQWEMMEKFPDYYRVGDAIGVINNLYPKSKFDIENTLLTNPAFESSLFKRLILVDTKIGEMKTVKEANQKIIALLRFEAK